MGSYLCTKYGVGNDLQYATQMKLIAYVVQELLILAYVVQELFIFKQFFNINL